STWTASASTRSWRHRCRSPRRPKTGRCSRIRPEPCPGRCSGYTAAMETLTTLLRRASALVALVTGLVLAALVAAFAFAFTLTLGAALWLAARFGARRLARDAQRQPGGPTAVIDVEMREIHPADRPRR